MLSVALFAYLLAGPGNLRANDDDFPNKVAPILQHHCLACHNDAQHEGDLSLQQAAGALDYIQPGDPESSRLLEVITPLDGKAEMPRDGKSLSAEQIKVISTWIKRGASWPADYRIEEPQVSDFQWWSYQPLVRPSVPKYDDAWVRTPIDAFVKQKLIEKQLDHCEPADRRTLIRRVTYDLIGLPPKPEEVAAFVTDTDPRAYEKLVDRLLDSKHYGQRWARHWLDVVKYADTCGYDKDKLRPNAWPYRDYVIRSLNEDKPYARFVQEQIAGDVLFPGDPDGILGLGFIAAGPWDFIGHVEVPETKIDGKVARNLDRDDMVANTLNTFCSVTVQCARCHNHKFDPITQEHYYSMQAIFAAVDRADRPYDLDPDVETQRRALQTKLASEQAELQRLEKEIADAAGPRLTELDKQIADLTSKLNVVKEPEFGYHSAISRSPDTEKWVEVDLGAEQELTKIILRPCHDDFAGIGAGFGFPVRFKVDVCSDDGNWVTVSDQTQQDYPNPKLVPFETSEFSAKVRRVRVTATKLVKRANDYIFALAELQSLDRDGNNVALAANVTAIDSIEAPTRWAKQNLTDGKWARGGDPTVAESLAGASKERTAILANVETPQRIQRRQSLTESIKQSQQQLDTLPQGKMVYAAATHFKPQGNFKPTEGNLRPIAVLHRGDIQSPRASVTPGVLPLGQDDHWRMDDVTSEAERRAELARWLTRDDHPLVWRSIVNRVWQYHFGQGIVATPNDFGRMGAQPTHPELLDWLAVEFRDGGQSLKQLHRLIVTSSVYQQSSRHDESMAAIDGSNQYLWRMNRRRLSAEEIRDAILAVSGALIPEMGGPGFYLFKLEKTTHSPHYEYHKFDPADPVSHRRSIYRFIVRSQPDPYMTTLDCADSSQSTPRRSETLTSLQALSLLNNRFNLVMAERFAGRLEKEASDLPEQIELAMKLIAGRSPTDWERKDLLAYARKHGLANLCRMMFNLSEFVFLD